jgi:hypothetical protein
MDFWIIVSILFNNLKKFKNLAKQITNYELYLIQQFI